jgi:hypothetical protein
MAKKTAKEKEFEFEWDPIKYAKDGAEAKRVIWSTKVLDAAIEGIKKGLPLVANPFIGKNTKLLKPDLVFRTTDDEVQEVMKCMEDPVYFAKYCSLMTPEGLKPVVLRDYQEKYLRHLQNNRFSILLAARQSGKCVGFNTTVYVAGNIKAKCYFYLKDKDLSIVPMFELYNKYCKQTFVWKIKYFLYKTIWQVKREQLIKNIMRTANVV